MTADLLQFPTRTPQGRPRKLRIDDVRHAPLDRQPEAVTRPCEPWALNGYHMARVVIPRDGDLVTVADFKTARDAALAVQCRAIVDRIIEARDRPSRNQPGVMSSLDFADDVLQILGEYGR